VGVASLVAWLSLGIGLQSLATKRLSNSGLFDTVVVTQRRNLQSMRRPPAESSPAKDARPLDDDAKRDFEKLPNVVEVYSQIRFPTEVHYNGSPYSTVVAGIPASAQGNGSFDGMQGNFFSGPNADEAILQIEFARDLSAQPNSLIGKDLIVRYAERQALPPPPAGGKAGADPSDASAGGFSIVPREKKLHIVGIIETEPAAGFGGFGSGRLLIPLEVASALRATQVNDLRDAVRATSGKPVYASLTVRAKSPALVGGIETSIKNMGFGTFSLLDATKNLRVFFTIFDMLLFIFGSLALAVATLGIINTLVMAILERRREIGILKALGAADRDVKQLFFVEAGVMGLLGGILGVGFGWLVGRAVTIGTNLYLKRQSLPSADVFSVPWWLVLTAILVAILVSLVAGLYPASRAARLDPVEALRYE
ncbi:MAG TPA: FtsX-like permease family protein, partial [Candidatus Acidoferrum sp.]